MATNLMNNQLKQLNKLGKDVEDLEKKLKKVFDDADERKSSPNGRGNACLKTSNETKPFSNNVVRNNYKRPIPKYQRKAKSATLEVTVKTKRHGKSSKPKVSVPESVPKTDSRKRTKPFGETVPGEENQHCCCQLNSRNMVWSNILKHSELPNSVVPNSREERIISCEEDYEDRVKDHCGNNCRNRRPQLHPHKPASQPSDHDTEKESVGSNFVCNDILNSRKCSKEDSKVQNNPQISNVGRLKPQITGNGVGKSSDNDSSSQRIDNLCILMKEFLTATTSQPTQTLVQDVEAALKQLCKAAATSSEASVSGKLSSRKLSNGELIDEVALKKNNQMENKMEIPYEKPRQVADAIVQVPLICDTDDNNVFINGGRAKEDNLISQSDSIQNSNRKFAVAEKFELLVKVNDDDSAKRQYILGNDEKLKAEIEYLNKQLNLQLKSVEGLSTKESEYHKLISSLIEKVDKLETQVNAQTKATQHFYGQCNTLLEQNSVIPRMRKKHDQLNKQLRDTIHNYEKLKIEYCMMKLEKEKCHALVYEKDKEIRRFKEEIGKVQTLVSQQMQDVKGYVGYASAAEKVDALLCIIDSQSNLIKSKINGAKELDEVNISALKSPSPSSSSAQSRPFSPFSYSVRLNSPDQICKPSTEANGPEGNADNNIH